MRPDAVVFDIGNVLLKWDPEGFYDRRIGHVARVRLFQEVPLAEMKARIDAGAPWHATVEETARTYRRWGRDILSWRDDWAEMAGPILEDSLAVLRALKARGVPVFALTNFGRETFALARRLHPALTEFDGAVVSGHEGVTKPDPAIFETLERRSGIAAERLFYTDDSLANVEAAAAQGWRTHHFTSAAGLARRLVEEGLLKESDAPPPRMREDLPEAPPEDRGDD
jgi:2-haloacid dehalogenase